MPSPLTKYQVDKIGNSIIFLGERVSELTKTKLLKLLFLLEECSIKKTGKPFFGVNFKIWQFGPVAPILFDGLTDIDNTFLSNYITKNRFEEYEGIKDFDDSEFSNNDLQILAEVVNFARHKIAHDLVLHTHAPDSLWRQGAIKHDVYEKFNKKQLEVTDFDIDFTLLFEHDAEHYLSERYETATENLEHSKKYNSTLDV